MDFRRRAGPKRALQQAIQCGGRSHWRLYSVGFWQSLVKSEEVVSMLAGRTGGGRVLQQPMQARAESGGGPAGGRLLQQRD